MDEKILPVKSSDKENPTKIEPDILTVVNRIEKKFDSDWTMQLAW